MTKVKIYQLIVVYHNKGIPYDNRLFFSESIKTLKQKVIDCYKPELGEKWIRIKQPNTNIFRFETKNNETYIIAELKLI